MKNIAYLKARIFYTIVDTQPLKRLANPIKPLTGFFPHKTDGYAYQALNGGPST